MVSGLFLLVIISQLAPGNIFLEISCCNLDSRPQGSTFCES